VANLWDRTLALTQANDYAGLEAARLKHDLSRIETVAWLLPVDEDAAFDLLGHYARVYGHA